MYDVFLDAPFPYSDHIFTSVSKCEMEDIRKFITTQDLLLKKSLLYKIFYETVVENNDLLNKSVPDFMVNDSIKYFEKIEQYEKCHLIKSFFDNNPKRKFTMSRNEWMKFGWQFAGRT